MLMHTDSPAVPTLVDRVRALTQAWDRENGQETYPADRIAMLAAAGATASFVVLDSIASVDALVTVLRLIGGADLSLGRIYEGHVNAAQLVHAYGDAGQRRTLVQDLADHKIFGVWNTEPAPMTLEPMNLPTKADTWRLGGGKSFATGAGHIDRALITARRPDGAKQLVLVDIAGMTARVDNAGWRVRGMRGTQSGRFDFTDMIVGPEAVIGGPNDYEQEPRFSAGAWRFAAVQLGAVEALVRHWRDHLVTSGKDGDPVQRARIGAAMVAARSATLWVSQAAKLAEAGHPDAIAHVLMTRGVVEEAGLAAMEGAARGIGTAAFFDGSRVDRITRDLGLYLRQPVPDQARDRAVGAWLEADRWGDDRWW
ncbi:acyl-CoA dehydrogenase [Sphingomonas sp. PB4P5]|uniref:acyl-CoA dehydrogenase n=1 Tax=Parasphingomonas puruogangriensis TaxID=3096155 RepID=UPI003B562C37